MGADNRTCDKCGAGLIWSSEPGKPDWYWCGLCKINYGPIPIGDPLSKKDEPQTLGDA